MVFKFYKDSADVYLNVPLVYKNLLLSIPVNFRRNYYSSKIITFLI